MAAHQLMIGSCFTPTWSSVMSPGTKQKQSSPSRRSTLRRSCMVRPRSFTWTEVRTWTMTSCMLSTVRRSKSSLRSSSSRMQGKLEVSVAFTSTFQKRSYLRSLLTTLLRKSSTTFLNGSSAGTWISRIFRRIFPFTKCFSVRPTATERISSRVSPSSTCLRTRPRWRMLRPRGWRALPLSNSTSSSGLARASGERLEISATSFLANLGTSTR
mmetsp:Transcript_3112/g.10860  ORF Transcript_3112/g.10860 Transcript_3112/m.10860 type:complete len:213 (-) Transcript_3112:1908-2546(-)